MAKVPGYTIGTSLQAMALEFKLNLGEELTQGQILQLIQSACRRYLLDVPNLLFDSKDGLFGEWKEYGGRSTLIFHRKGYTGLTALHEFAHYLDFEENGSSRHTNRFRDLHVKVLKEYEAGRIRLRKVNA